MPVNVVKKTRKRSLAAAIPITVSVQMDVFVVIVALIRIVAKN